MVARSSHYRSVGIDLDDERPLGNNVAKDLMSDDEVQRVLMTGIAANVDEAHRFVFSAKEAVFKCQFPLTGNADLDFDDVQLIVPRVSRNSPGFVASFRTHVAMPTWLYIEVFPFMVHTLLLAIAIAPFATHAEIV